MAEHWYDTTTLDDLLGVDPARSTKTRLYRALDHLGEHKDAFYSHLMQRYRQWIGVRFEFLLHDVTSTYFEGESELNPQAQRGYTRDQRSGNKQVCIGLVCTPESPPLSFEVFSGNRADITTVELIVRVMEGKYEQAERVWVLDLGMVSEANLAFLRKRKARYLVGTPTSWLRANEKTLFEQSDWNSVQEGLRYAWSNTPRAKSQTVLCYAVSRREPRRSGRCCAVRASV